MSQTFRRARLGLVLTAVVALSACASDPAPQPGDSASPSGTTAAGAPLTVVAHESFHVPDELIKKFEQETGHTVTITTPGDAGTLVNQLVLTKDSPLGDVVFGIDNTFAGRALREDVIEPYDSPAVPANAADLDVEALNPIDHGDVCINADTQWFTEKNLTPPTTFDDLTKPEYKDLLVISNPASSSPGLAMLVATWGQKGDGYLDYWKALKDNGMKVVPGWTEAYNTEFSGAEGKGPRPLVLSYASSPAFTVSEDGSTSSTTALLQTCFRQVEYAGVLKGAKNPDGARAFIDFLLSPEVQATIPEQMYMYPVADGVGVPDTWEKFAPLSGDPIIVAASDIDANRDRWIEEWTSTVIG